MDSDSRVIDSDVDYVDTWMAMEHLQRKGLVKSIGVCNFNRRQIERLLRVATISPVTNRVGTHTLGSNDAFKCLLASFRSNAIPI